MVLISNVAYLNHPGSFLFWEVGFHFFHLPILLPWNLTSILVQFAAANLFSGGGGQGSKANIIIAHENHLFEFKRPAVWVRPLGEVLGK